VSKYKLSWDQKKYESYLKEGRGSGIGKDYNPWITIHDFPSKGVSSRTPGWKSNRVHHFLSQNELRYFFLLEWANGVIDIREQFPLLDLEDAMQIAEESSIKYPVDNKSKTPYILTSDFMITVNRDGKEISLVRTIKPSDELENSKVIEKFEIERKYWKKRNIDWGIVTESEIPKNFALNVEWVHSSYKLEAMKEVGITQLFEIGELLKERLSKNESTITRITTLLDREINVASGTSLYVFKYLVARKEIILDMNQMIDINTSTDAIHEIIKNNGKVMAL